jgi:hypothetical protein
VVSFLLAFPPKSHMHFSSPHPCYMLCQSHPPCLAHSNDTSQIIQVMKLLIVQSSLTSRHFISPVQILSSAPCSQTPSATSMYETDVTKTG